MKNGLPSLFVALAATAFFFFNAVSTALCSLYPTEVFPTEIRGAGVGFATATSRIGAAAGTFLLPIAMERLGMPPTMLIAAAICVAGGIVSHLLAPETKGLALGEASAPAAPHA